MKKDIFIIGGGFFGLFLASYFARKGHSVYLSEKEDDFMQRASFTNQARVHNGYHYPRSILTALRSRVSLPRFQKDFESCIDDSFDNYYMISRVHSKVTARQFQKFCQRIGAPCEAAPTKITKLTNPHLIEAVFTTKEFVFDALKLKEIMVRRAEAAGVSCNLNQVVTSVKRTGEKLLVNLSSATDGAELSPIVVDEVFNCTYSMINKIHQNSGIELVDLKHEMTEMALVEVPEELKNCGITVMDGPFFSMMPFPPRKMHTFSHVRYTPHYEWHDTNGSAYIDAHRHYTDSKKNSAWRHMIQDAQRYIPILAECRYKDSIWEVKTVLPRSESDDARPILFQKDHGLKGFHSVMGGKIDNVYDVIDFIANGEFFT